LTYVAVPLEGRTLADLASVGVSLEPAEGSPYADKPSGPRVFLIPLAPPEAM
jgi:anti-sigma-K factor RskA